MIYPIILWIIFYANGLGIKDKETKNRLSITIYNAKLSMGWNIAELMVRTLNFLLIASHATVYQYKQSEGMFVLLNK